MISGHFQVYINSYNEFLDIFAKKLKMWGDVALFTGRFDRIEDQINGFPTYKASRGDLKLFFSKASG